MKKVKYILCCVAAAVIGCSIGGNSYHQGCGRAWKKVLLSG